MIEIIIFVVGFALIAFLIFKFIKKLVFAILSLLLLVVLIFGVFIGIVYFDYKYYAGFEEGSINIYTLNNQEALYGIELQIKNGTIVPSDIKSAGDFKTTIKKDKQITFTIDKDVYYDLLKNETSYKYPVDDLKENFVEIKLEKETIIKILEAKNPKEVMEEEINENVYLLMKPYIEQIGDEKSFIFMLTLTTAEYEDREVKIFAQAFDDKKINIIPERMSIKMFRSFFPTSFFVKSLDGIEYNASIQ